MIEFNEKSANTRLDDLRKNEEEKLIQALAPQYGYDYINLHGYTINPEAVALIPEDKAREANLVAFEVTHNTLSIAATKPNDPVTIKLLSEIQNNRQNIIIFMCSTSSLKHGWERYIDLINTSARKKGVFDIDTDFIAKLMKEISTKEDVIKKMKSISTINNSRRVTETIELLFAGAIGLFASDIHIEPEENVVRVRYRLDGVLHDIYDIDRYIYERLISRLKLLAGMTLNKRMMAQDGRFTFIVNREIEIRVSVIPGASGESIVMRLLDPSVASFKMENIDLNPILKEIIIKELKKPNGLIITTGPTGSGKTTALYTFLKETHKEGVKIITIENPVEYKLEGIVQTQTGDEYTFASGLRAILRQDPDVILVGEIRDREVAETAMHAAQTGHLVFTTLHTNSAVGGFPRLIDLGVDPRIVGSAINIILGQRLVRKLCDKCKKQYPPNQKESDLINQVLKSHPEKPAIPEKILLYKAVGCPDCDNSGYSGREGIFEAILMDEAVEEAVLRDPREHIILQAAHPQGIPTMIEDGIKKVVEGTTSLDELERVIELPNLNQNNTPTSSSNSEKNSDEDIFLAHTIN